MHISSRWAACSVMIAAFFGDSTTIRNEVDSGHSALMESTPSAPDTPSRAAVEPLPSPAGPGSRFPSLSRSSDGRIALTWTERAPDSSAVVRVAVRDRGGRWSPAHSVVKDSALVVNFADFARVAWLSNGGLAVTWLQRGAATGKYDYGVRLATSRDNGATWTAPTSPHDAGEKGEHGFVSLLPRPNGGLSIAYLNGREAATSKGAMQLHVTTLGSTARKETSGVDLSVCDCCQTAAAMTSRGAIVAYRDRTEAEIRDIAVVREENGRWTPPQVVTADRWMITGCPVNGPALAAAGNRVALVWFSAARDTAKVQLAFSTDAGKTFGAPIRLDAGNPAGHVDVALGADGTTYVSWLERIDNRRSEIRVRAVDRTGVAGETTVIGAVNAPRSAGWPALMTDGSELLVAWTAAEKPTSVKLARVVFKGPR